MNFVMNFESALLNLALCRFLGTFLPDGNVVFLCFSLAVVLISSGVNCTSLNLQTR